jgi:hypothetical protein
MGTIVIFIINCRSRVTRPIQREPLFPFATSMRPSFLLPAGSAGTLWLVHPALLAAGPGAL